MTAPNQRPYLRTTAKVDADGWARVFLDDAPLRTPRGGDLRLPTAGLAAAIAQEWDSQGEKVQPNTMPMTRLANVSTDLTPLHRGGLIEAVLDYAKTDLLCHRAGGPEKLVALQAARWDAPLQWAAEQGIDLPITAGIIAQPVGALSLTRVRALAGAFDDFALTGLAHAVAVSGSAVLGLAMAHRVAPAGDALFEVVALDELWSIQQWGEDTELATRLERLKLDLAALERWFTLIAE